MATSYTSLLRFALQGTGDNDNTWGQVLNTQLQLIQAAVTGSANIVLASNDYTLSLSSGSDDEARAKTLNLTGNPTSDLSVIVPALEKTYIVRNNTTGTFDVTVRTLSGSGQKAPRGEARLLYCDATNVLFTATAHDAAKVGGMTPGNAVTRDVDPNSASGLLDRDDLDTRYVQSGSQTGVGTFTTGDVKMTYKTAEVGWVNMDDGSIGPTNSGATTRADNDTEALYAVFWNNVDDQYAPVSTGRGASAAIDWAAGKVLLLPKMLGRALASAGNGVTLTERDLGQALGAETHTLTEAESAAHFHYGLFSQLGNGGDPSIITNKELTLKAGRSSDGQNDWTADGSASEADAGRSSTEGGGQPHNNMQPTSFINVLVKL